MAVVHIFSIELPALMMTIQRGHSLKGQRSFQLSDSSDGSSTTSRNASRNSSSTNLATVVPDVSCVFISFLVM